MTAAGWYDDGSGRQRWWDGQQWTDHVANAAQIGPYPVTHELGRGSFGVVYLGTHPSSGTHVAIKVFEGAGAEARASLQREAAGLLSVRSPYCLQVIDVIDTPQALALVTEYIPGVTLRTLMDAHGQLAGPQALQVLWGASQGLAAVHTAGLVHGDIKPANILVSPEGASKLIDFGLVGAPGLAAPDGSASGSPAYAAPEQMLHGIRDNRSDIYALSVTLFEALCGQRPYSEASIPELAMAHAQKPVPDPRAFAPQLSSGLASLVMDGMAKDPAARPQDMQTFLDRFQRGAAETYGPDWLAIGGLGAVAVGVIAGGALASGALAGSSSAAAGVGAVGAAGAGGFGAGAGAGIGAGASGGAGAFGSGASVAALGGGAKAALVGAAVLATVSAGVGGIAMGVTQPSSPAPAHSQGSGSGTRAQTASNTATTANFMIVIDTSGSMSDPAVACDASTTSSVACSDQSKIDAASSAATSLVQMIQRQGSSVGPTNVGVVTFSDSAQTAEPMGTNYGGDLSALSGLQASGQTDLPGGIEQGISDLRSMQGSKTMILLTDGMSTTGDPTQAAQDAAAAGIKIDTVGFGDPSQNGSDQGVDVNALQTIASTTNGTYAFADNGTLLRQIFWEARYSSIGSVVASDQGQLSQGEASQTKSATVGNGQGTLEVALAWPGSDMNVVLTDPSGNVVAQGDSGANVVHQSTQEFVTIKNPAAGNWKVQVRATETNGQEQYGVVAATYGARSATAPIWPKAVLGGGLLLLFLVGCFGFWRFLRRAATH